MGINLAVLPDMSTPLSSSASSALAGRMDAPAAAAPLVAQQTDTSQGQHQ
jgi:hypothetical protein